jgi:hypothetical protein
MVRSWHARGAVALGLTIATTLVMPIGSASAADNGTWAATPSVAGQQAPRQYFFLDMADGQTVTDSVTITNVSPQPKRLTLFPSDAYNVADGAGFAVTDFGAPVDDVGSWITLSRDAVIVPAATRDEKDEVVPGKVRVPFKVTVPRGAAPGDHAGAITTLEEAPPPSGDTSQLLVRRQLAVRTYVRVDGPLTTSLAVERVTLSAEAARLPFIGRQGAARVEYVIKNNGNTRVTPDRLVTLTGLFGRNLHTSPPGKTPEILPGSTVILYDDFEGLPVLDRVTARVDLSAAQGEVKAAGDTSEWVISLTFLILLVVLIVLVLLAIRFGPARKARAQQAGVEQGGAVVTEPV